MNDAAPPKEPTSIEIALAGYQAAIDLWTFSSAQAWERFNIMLAANSILIAAMGLSSPSGGEILLFRFFLPSLGVVLCAIWFLLVSRSFDFAEYYTFSARELEERHLSPIVETVSRGAVMSHGRRVHFEFNDGPASSRLAWSARRIRARTAAYVTMALFFIFYLLALGIDLAGVNLSCLPCNVAA